MEGVCLMGVVFVTVRKIPNNQVCFSFQWPVDTNFIILVALSCSRLSRQLNKRNTGMLWFHNRNTAEGIFLDFLFFFAITCDKYCISQQHKEKMIDLFSVI